MSDFVRLRELIDSNPAEGANRPRIPKRHWRILKPEEIRRVSKAFKDDQARSVFLTLVLTGLRASELRRLRWRDASLVEKVLRVVDSKSESGIRSIAIPSSLAEELTRHYQRTAFKGDGDLVFCHPKRGTVYSKEIWTPLFAAALKPQASRTVCGRSMISDTLRSRSTPRRVRAGPR